MQEVLVEPLPLTVDQGSILVKAGEINELSLAQNQMPTQIRALGLRGERIELSSIFAAICSSGHSWRAALQAIVLSNFLVPARSV